MRTPRGALKIISAFIKFQYNNSAAPASCATTAEAAAHPFLNRGRKSKSAFELLHYIARVYIMQISWVHILLMSWCVIALAP
jgi:hypothetical protein